MTTIHAQKSFYVGDAWEIRGRLYDRDRRPLDINGLTIEWGLLDAAGGAVLLTDDVTITPTAPTTDGAFTILVPPAKTAALPPGIYTDACRISSLTIPRETMWSGPIIAKPTPFELLV